jgi:hypothetical protein
MRLFTLIAALLLAGPALGQAPTPVPLLNLASIAGLRAQDRSQAARFLTLNTPRVFAIGPNGAFGWQAGGGTAEEVESRAIETCKRSSNGAPCLVAVRDLSLLLPGRAWTAQAPPESIAISSLSHETVPDSRFLWWGGPQQARGALVFAHGRSPGGADSRGRQPQSWTRHFNNAGYDVWRFDRHPNTDERVRAAGWLRDDLAELRRRGYRHIIVAGQSRGGWNALMVLDTPGLADAYIAIAPAAHGGLGSREHLAQLDDLRSIVSAAASAPQARLAVASFRGDEYDPEPDRRSVLLRELGARVGAFLFIDRPEQPTGHGGGATTVFNDRFGACLFRFATATPPPAAC